MNTLLKYTGLALLHLFAVLPQGLKKILADVSGWLMWRFNGKVRKLTVRNLEICFPDMPEEERTQLARRSLSELMLSVLDLGRNWVWEPERLMQQVERVVGLDILHAAMAGGNGVVGLAPHMGNWELTNLILCKYFPVTTLYREPRTAIFDDVIRRRRERSGANLVRAGTSAVRAMLKALKSGEMVTLLPDQVPPKELGEFAPFFGEPALTMTIATNLIQRTGARAVLGYGKRLPGGKYEIIFSAADDAIYDPDRSIALTALNKSIERCVMECPEQYQWEYRRFKYLPNLQRRDYFADHKK